jgi:glycopeptide antibiotics resistance protein
VCANAYQLATRTFSKRFLLVEFFLYLILLVIFVLFKSRGMQGINLNPLEIVNNINEGAFEVFMNILIFVPFGLGCVYFLKTPKKTILVSLILIVLAELAQYAFSLGFCDIIDVITNLLGVVLGFYVGRALTKKLSFRS